ncbi:aminotransferase class I/II-fold pyridoxal phosphate-dependent enzyme [uncultured Helicobacter sp.]|uniref:aminotransferase class I/II-fold pyridoxal phosphate-dependent enzyme n=1 Tax=uncultured Helicobacter sp. TaxID=175537 RepID=UPI00374FAB24
MNPFTKALSDFKAQHSLRELQPYTHDGVFVRGDLGEQLLNLASNDYLGLQILWREHIAKFLQNASKEIAYLSSSSSRLLSGDFPIFSQLESLIASLYGKDCLLFNSGYHANVGMIGALGKLGKVLFLIDEYAHASVFDGIALSRAHFRRFAHNDMQALQELLAHYQSEYDMLIIVVEGLYSMDGDFAPIAELVALKKCYDNVYLYLDEAHSIGVCGDDGLGRAKELELSESIDFLILTFGKAISSVGACVVCHSEIKHYCVNTARSLIYSTALPPLNVAFSAYVFASLSQLAPYRIHLHNLSTKLKHKLVAYCQNSIVLGEAHILSIVVKSNERALKLAEHLRKRGIFAPAIRYPSVPKELARVRICLNAALQPTHIHMLLEAIQEANL